MWKGLLCACLGTAWVTSAQAASADDLRNDWSGEYGGHRNISITVMPMSLLDARNPRLDITGEIRASEDKSIAITSSMAMARYLHDVAPKGQRELGLQLRDYIIGGFGNGLFLGGQVAFTNPDLMRMRADATRFGPMAGMKVSLSIFTVEGRAGAWLDMGKQGLSVEPRVDFATGFTF